MVRCCNSTRSVKKCTNRDVGEARHLASGWVFLHAASSANLIEGKICRSAAELDIGTTDARIVRNPVSRAGSNGQDD